MSTSIVVMVIQKTSTVEITMRKVNGRPQYFMRTAVPKVIGLDILGLNLETKGQKLIWKVSNKKVFIEVSK